MQRRYRCIIPPRFTCLDRPNVTSNMHRNSLGGGNVQHASLFTPISRTFKCPDVPAELSNTKPFLASTRSPLSALLPRTLRHPITDPYRTGHASIIHPTACTSSVGRSSALSKPSPASPNPKVPSHTPPKTSLFAAVRVAHGSAASPPFPLAWRCRNCANLAELHNAVFTIISTLQSTAPQHN